MNIKCYIAAIATIALSSCATGLNPYFVNAHWHMGNVTVDSRQSGDTIIFEGGSLHEGGTVFCLLPLSKTDSTETFTLKPYNEYNSEGNWVYWNSATKDCEVTLKKLENDTALVATNKEGEPIDIAIKYDGNLKKIIYNNILNKLEGTYTSSDKREFKFFKNQTTNINGSPLSYKLLNTFDTPSQILEMSDGSHYTFQTTPDSLIIFNGEYYEEEDSWSQGCLKEKLIWTSPSNAAMKANRWSFISNEILTVGTLNLYSIDEIKKMQQTFMFQKQLNKIEEFNFSLINNELTHRIAQQEKEARELRESESLNDD